MKHRNILNRTTHLILLVVFISHLTFAHELMSEYVLCTGIDGHVAIEKLDDCSECNKVDFLNQTNGTEIKKKACEDISLDENCFEDAQFLSKNKIVTSIIIITLALIPTETNTHSTKYITNNSFRIADQTLESYTTVSLII